MSTLSLSSPYMSSMNFSGMPVIGSGNDPIGLELLSSTTGFPPGMIEDALSDPEKFQRQYNKMFNYSRPSQQSNGNNQILEILKRVAGLIGEDVKISTGPDGTIRIEGEDGFKREIDPKSNTIDTLKPEKRGLLSRANDIVVGIGGIIAGGALLATGVIAGTISLGALSIPGVGVSAVGAAIATHGLMKVGNGIFNSTDYTLTRTDLDGEPIIDDVTADTEKEALREGKKRIEEEERGLDSLF